MRALIKAVLIEKKRSGICEKLEINLLNLMSFLVLEVRERKKNDTYISGRA